LVLNPSSPQSWHHSESPNARPLHYTGYGVTQQVIGNLNLNNFGWKVELGECEFKHVDTDDQIESPCLLSVFCLYICVSSSANLNAKHAADSARGLVRLSSSNKEAMGKQFKDVEDQLINSKLSLAQIQAEKFDLQNEVSVADERFNKLKNEMKTLEQQLVQTKISLAEAQVCPKKASNSDSCTLKIDFPSGGK